MERPGEKLERVREKLKLTYRDVERFSQKIAARQQNDEYAIALSRLADIEHKGTVPTIFRLYSLCAIYRLNFQDVLGWYGVPLDSLASDALQTTHRVTHLSELGASGKVPAPQPDGELDTSRTALLSHLARRWGKAGLGLLNAVDLKPYRYGLIGEEDWSMHPILHPCSLVLIDPTVRRIASQGWHNELERPIYFLETREGYRCGWCSRDSVGRLILQFHPSSVQPPEILPSNEADLVGQVVGVAMRLEQRRPPTRS